MPPVSDIPVPIKPKRGRPPGPGKRAPEFAATLAEVRRLRKLGHSYREIGALIGMTQSGVHYYVKKFPEHVCPCCGREKQHLKNETPTPTSK